MQREAGTIVFTGLFSNGKGVGEFRFSPNGNFISTMRGLGYEELSNDKLFTMTLHDVGTRFISELKSLGYDKVPINKLIAMRIHGADGDFIREIESAGFKQVPVDKLIAMRIHGVNKEFIAKARTLGYGELPVDKLITMRIHGINEEYIKGVQALGTTTTSKAGGDEDSQVNGEYQGDESFGYNRFRWISLDRMRITTQRPVIREMKVRLQQPPVTIDQVRIHGVEA